MEYSIMIGSYIIHVQANNQFMINSPIKVVHDKFHEICDNMQQHAHVYNVRVIFMKSISFFKFFFLYQLPSCRIFGGDQMEKQIFAQAIKLFLISYVSLYQVRI